MESIHYANTYRMRWNLVIVRVLELLNNLFDGALESIVTDGTFLAGLDYARQQLLPIERLMASIPLDHPQIAALNLFISSKSILARETLATPTNRRTSLRRARIDNLVFKVSAFRASHRLIKSKSRPQHIVVMYAKNTSEVLEAVEGRQEDTEGIT